MGIATASGDYLVLTNDDNYYVPKFIENRHRADPEDRHPDVVYFDMIHSHNKPGGRQQTPYCLFKTEYKRQNIDMGAAVVRTELARIAGFRDKSHDGDATYFEEVEKAQERQVEARQD